MNRIRVWPHATLIILACAVLAAVAALLWTKYERSAQAKDLPLAARIERVDGQVGLNRTLDNASSAKWVEATANTPISVGDRIFTRDNSRSEIAFTGRNFALLEPNTSLDVLDLSDQRTQVALRDGSALFDVGAIASGELFEVATPCGAVDLEEAGVYQISVDNSGNAIASVLNGRAHVVGQGGTGKIEKGEQLIVSCQLSSGAVLSSIDAGQVGRLLDSYYGYRYPRTYDGRYRNYYTYLDDPYYYDPYRREISYQYVSDYIPGVADLDDYGNWEYVNDYGYCWHPYAGSGWAPYQSGYWDTEYPFGLTWISYEPWGYAPYHYGRWAFVTDRWFWIPEPVRTRPFYSPALVAFIPVQTNYVAWVPLGPGDPYVPRYYDGDWRARLLGREEFRDRLFNQNVAGGVTLVSVRDFNRKIDDRVIVRADPQEFAHARPVFDPMSIDSVRQAALATREARHRIDVPAALAERINKTTVLTSAAPPAPSSRRDLTHALRVESVPEKLSNQKLQFRDERSAGVAAEAGSANIAMDQARERRMAELSVPAARGDRAARMQLHILQHQQRVEGEAARQQAIVIHQQPRVMTQPKIEAERVGNQIRPVPRVLPPVPQPREKRPPASFRQPVQPQVIRPQQPPPVQAKPQRLPEVQVKPTQPSPRHIDRPQVQIPQARPQTQPKVEFKGPPVSSRGSDSAARQRRKTPIVSSHLSE